MKEVKKSWDWCHDFLDYGYSDSWTLSLRLAAYLLKTLSYRVARLVNRDLLLRAMHNHGISANFSQLCTNPGVQKGYSKPGYRRSRPPTL